MGSRKNSGLGGSLFLNGWGVSGPHFGYNDVHEKPARKQWEKAGQCQTHTYWQTHNTHIFPVRRRNATRKKKSGGKIAGDANESGCVYPARCGGLKNGPRVYGHQDETREGSKKKAKAKPTRE